MKNYSIVSSLYVSKNNGSDYNSGVYAQDDGLGNGPVATIERALRLVAGMRLVGHKQPVAIKLMDAQYDLNAPLRIGEVNTYGINGGAKVSDISIEPYGNERVLLSGGRQITGFAKDRFNGVECVSVYLPEVKEGKWTFEDLYVNGAPAQMTRYPEKGVFLPEQVEKEGGEEDSWLPSEWFIAKKGDIGKDCTDIVGAKIRFTHYWLEEMIRVKEFDFETRKCTLEVPTRMTVSAEPNKAASMQYYIENLACAFRREGDWYLDKPNGKLYYIPLKEQKVEELVVYAPVIDRIVEIDGKNAENKTRGIRFENIAFAYTKSEYQPYVLKFDDEGNEISRQPSGADVQAAVQLHGCVNFDNATECVLKNCEIHCAGTYGVKIHGTCDHIDVDGAYIHHCLGGGVSVGNIGPIPKSRYAHDITIRNCELCELGLKYLSGAGVLLIKAYDCVVEHNDIHDMYYSGVSVGWSWGFGETYTANNKIKYNRVYNIGKGVLSDMGGIYLVGKQEGTIVSNNIVHDVQSRNYGAIGLYADEGCMGVVFENNIVYNMPDCFHVHFGAMNTVRNNIFAYATRAAITTASTFPYMELILERNIILVDSKTSVYGGRGNMNPATSCCISSDYNIIFTTDGNAPVGMNNREEKVGLKTLQQQYGWDKNSLFSDPKFKDSKKGDFTLKEESPAFAIGFKPIKICEIGRNI